MAPVGPTGPHRRAEANRIIQTAIGKAEELDFKACVAVVDVGGRLVAFARMVVSPSNGAAPVAWAAPEAPGTTTCLTLTSRVLKIARVLR